MRRGGFPSPDEGLDDAGARAAAGHRLSRTPPSLLVTSPWLAARQTAAGLGEGQADEALRDIDHGAWTGRAFADLEPAALAVWLADPAAGAPGGEPLSAVVARMAVWLSAKTAADGALVAVTHPMVIRAALSAALDLPPPATLRIDIAPLCEVRLSFNRVWRLQALIPG